MGVRFRLRWALAAALAVHAGAAMGALHLARMSGGEGLASESQGGTELDVEVEPPPPEDRATAVEPSSPSPVSSEVVARAEARTTGAARAGSPEGTPETPAASAEPTGDGTWSFSPAVPAPSGTHLSSAALAAAVQAGVSATVAQDVKRRDPAKHLLRGITPHDVDLGLFPGSELVGMTRDAVRRSLAPDIGHALFEFHIDSAGVLAVHVLDASSDRRDWDEVAAGLTEAARGHPMRVPSGADGVALTLEVTSSMKTLSGETPTSSTITRVFRAINDPVDAVLDGKSPTHRVVAVRVVDVHAL